MVRQEVIRLVNGYLKLPDAEELVVLPELGDHAGILGCVALGQS
jgi:fructokinase